MNTEQFDGHTPGPWDILVCATTGEKFVVDGPDEAFANCLALVSRLGEDEGWKNMALMAAAPDLLAEVKRWQPITQGCDLARLKQQKQMLLAMIWEDHDHELWGLVNLLDALQDLLEGEEVIT